MRRPPWAPSAGVVISCVGAPPPAQPINRYSRPLASVVSDGAETVCFVPTPQTKLYDGQLSRPSTFNLMPVGLLRKDTLAERMNRATMASGILLPTAR